MIANEVFIGWDACINDSDKWHCSVFGDHEDPASCLVLMIAVSDDDDEMSKVLSHCLIVHVHGYLSTDHHQHHFPKIIFLVFTDRPQQRIHGKKQRRKWKYILHWNVMIQNWQLSRHQWTKCMFATKSVKNSSKKKKLWLANFHIKSVFHKLSSTLWWYLNIFSISWYCLLSSLIFA